MISSVSIRHLTYSPRQLTWIDVGASCHLACLIIRSSWLIFILLLSPLVLAILHSNVLSSFSGNSWWLSKTTLFSGLGTMADPPTTSFALQERPGTINSMPQENSTSDRGSGQKLECHIHPASHSTLSTSDRREQHTSGIAHGQRSQIDVKAERPPPAQQEMTGSTSPASALQCSGEYLGHHGN